MKRPTPTRRTVRDRIVGRAWSRAGAVAAVVSRGAPRRVLTTGARMVYLVLGSSLIAVSVAVTLWNQLGPGPLDVFIGAIRERTGLPLTIAVWATVGSLIALAWVLGRRPGPGTFLAPFLIGPVLDGALTTLDRLGAPPALLPSVGLHVVAIAGIGLGAGMLIVSAETINMPAPRPMPAIATTWRPTDGSSAGGAPSRSSVVRAPSSTGPIRNGARNVPGPGRRPRTQARAMSEPTVAHTAMVSGRPVRSRIAPMKTSSGPGPSWFQSVTATDTAISDEPSTRYTMRAPVVSTRRGAPRETTAATAPARDQARPTMRSRTVRRVGVGRFT
ncbi:MAG: hypothetical protein AAFP84_12095 [Actinomycetota bacterium]